MAGPGFVAAFDFGGTKTALATATAGGEILHHDRFEIDASRGAAAVLGAAIEACRRLICRTRAQTGGRCVSAGVVAPGIVLPRRSLLAPNVPGWEALALQPLVSDGLGLQRVAVGNDVKAAGLAELRWGALQGADPALFLSLGTGVAAAVIVGGQVLQGAHGAAGEIGYSLRGVDDKLAFAAGHAPLEEVAGGRFIGLHAERLRGRAMTAAEAFAATDGPMSQLVDHALDELAVCVANIALVVDPERIAVGGGLMGSGERVLEALERRLRDAVPFAPLLARARFADDAALRGAVALALEAAAAPQPERGSH